MDINEKLITACLDIKDDVSPINIVRKLMQINEVPMHGPIHHFIDGASLLVAYYNAGGSIDLSACLHELAKRASTMPGAMCGYWGMCGSVASCGAAMSIIDKTSPLSNDEHYKKHMEYASITLHKMAMIGGPRCCKRNGFLSIICATEFINNNYDVKLKVEDAKCFFSNANPTCLKKRCPFYQYDNR